MEGDEKYPFYLIVTDTNTDQNTPLLIVVEEESEYESFVVGNTYKIKVYIINVIENNKNHIRYSFILN